MFLKHLVQPLDVKNTANEETSIKYNDTKEAPWFI